MPKYNYPFSDRRIQIKIFCVCDTLQITRFFEVKAKSNVSLPSDVINRPELTDFNTKRSLLWVHSVVRTRISMIVQKTDFSYLYFMVKYAKIEFFIVPGKGDG